MHKSGSSDANSVGSFMSPSAASQRRFQSHGSTVLAVLEKPSNQVHVDFDEFYAERVGNFEKERGIFSHYFRLIEPKRDDTYNLEWENRKLLEEARLSKLEFSQLEEKINQIRKDVEYMKDEGSEEQNGQSVRRQQIRRLEELARPVERDIAYIVPDRFTQFRERETRKSSKQGTHRDKSSRATSQSGAPSAGQASILDPTKSVKTGEVLQLESRLHDETIRVTSLLQDVHAQIRNAVENRHVSTVQYAETHSDEIDCARLLWQEHDAVDFQCFYAVAELLKLRFRIMIAQREEIEALETLQRDRDDFKEREEELKNEILEEMERSRKSMKLELEDSMREFQHQLVSLEVQTDNLQRKKYELETTQSKISQKEEHLSEELTLWEGRYEKLRRRHALDMEGYRREIAMLEKKLQQLEKQEKKRLQRVQQQHDQQKLLLKQRQEQSQQLKQQQQNQKHPPSAQDESWQALAEQLAQMHFHNGRPAEPGPFLSSTVDHQSIPASPKRVQVSIPSPHHSASKTMKLTASPSALI